MKSEDIAMADTKETKEKKRPRSKGQRAYLILGGLSVLAITAYLGYGWYTGNQASTDDAQIDTDIVPISTRVGGPVLHLYVKDNQNLKKGDPIADIDPQDYEIRVAQAEGDLEAAKAQAEVPSAKNGVPVNAAQVAAAQAMVTRTEAELRKAEADLARARRLQTQKAISPVELENAQRTAEEVRANSALAQAQLKVAIEQHTFSTAKVKSAEAALRHAKTQLSYTKIIAPRDGTLSRLAIQEGQLLQAGQMLAQLADNHTYVIANFKETQIGRMKPGQHAEISIDTYPGHSFSGEVESLSPVTGARFSLLPPDNASGNFVKIVQRVPVKIRWLEMPENVSFKAGLSTDVTVYFK